MAKSSTFAPRTVALLGLGEAGTAIAEGLCGEGGWRAAEAGRQVIAIDVALGEGARGTAIATRANTLALPITRDYGEALSSADLVISVVTGEDAPVAARMARTWLRPGTFYADFNAITGPQVKVVATELAPAGVNFVDVAVMGSFKAVGHRIPLVLSGPHADDLAAFAAAIGAPAKVLSDGIGDASAVKILRSILMKGIEALSVEFLVAARRQGLVDQVLDNLGDVDALGLAEFVKIMAITHLAHAKRRMEEMEKAIQNLDETGVPALMSEAIRRSHQRTVDAGLDPAEIADVDLETAIRILDEQVVDPVN